MPPIAKAKDHFGLNRSTSEDVHRIHEELGLYIVADGARSQDGRWAAEMACDIVCTVVSGQKGLIEDYASAPSRTKRLQIEKALEQAVQEASAAVYVAASEGRKRFTSTAIEALLVLKDYAISAHVGNTRLYFLSGAEPILLTQDHTLYEEMIHTKRDAEKISPSFKHQLTRAIGPQSSVSVDTFPIPMVPDAVFLLCSNGLSDAFEQGAGTLRVLRDSCPIDQLHQKLVEYAVSRKIDDNITALVVRASQESSTKGSSQEIRRQLDILRRMEFFQGIRDNLPALFKVHSVCDFRKVASQGTIVQEGAPGNELFVLLGGHADVIVGGRPVDVRSPGDAIGEMAFFTRELRSATVVAKEQCILMSLKRSDFDALVARDPGLGYQIVEGVVSELAKKLKVQTVARISS